MKNKSRSDWEINSFKFFEEIRDALGEASGIEKVVEPDTDTTKKHGKKS